jgi:hypothetical protein
LWQQQQLLLLLLMMMLMKTGQLAELMVVCICGIF